MATDEPSVSRNTVSYDLQPSAVRIVDLGEKDYEEMQRR